MQAKVIDHPSRARQNAYYNRGSGPRLVACSSIIRGKVISLKPGRWLPFVIGAADHCDFVISGSTMQASHIGIEMVEGQWVLSALDDKAWSHHPTTLQVYDAYLSSVPQSVNTH